MTDALTALSEAGVSIWLDDLSRERLMSGSLARLAARDHVVGVTTNPSIFAKAITEGLGASGLHPVLDPGPGRCCVAISAAQPTEEEGQQ